MAATAENAATEQPEAQRRTQHAAREYGGVTTRRGNDEGPPLRSAHNPRRGPADGHKEGAGLAAGDQAQRPTYRPPAEGQARQRTRSTGSKNTRAYQTDARTRRLGRPRRLEPRGPPPGAGRTDSGRGSRHTAAEGPPSRRTESGERRGRAAETRKKGEPRKIRGRMAEGRGGTDPRRAPSPTTETPNWQLRIAGCRGSLAPRCESEPRARPRANQGRGGPGQRGDSGGQDVRAR